MVASAASDLYAGYLGQGFVLDEGPTSSEDGSGLQSPVFGGPFFPGDSSGESPPFDLYHPDARSS